MINITPSTQIICSSNEELVQKKEIYFDLTRNEKDSALEKFEEIYENELRLYNAAEEKAPYGDTEVVIERSVSEEDKEEATRTVLDSIEHCFDQIFGDAFDIYDEEEDLLLEQETKEKKEEIIRFLKHNY